MSLQAVDTRMPVIAVTGDAASRGHQHGEALRDSIAACLAIYESTFKLSDADVAARAGHFEAVTRAWNPDLASEIDAIADAANQPRHWLWALNSRSEIMSYTGAQESECTSVWSASTRTLAQNWDWMESLEPLTVVLDATDEDGHHLVTVTEPGMLGKVGMSSAGVAVGLNFLSSPEKLEGVPVHALLRSMLDARSGDEVEQVIESAGVGRSAHVFLGTAAGVGSSIEYTGTQMWRHDSDSAPIVHANHFVNAGDDAGELPDQGSDSSHARHSRAAELVAANGVDSAESIRALLDDSDNESLPICRPWAESPTLPGVNSGTVCAIVMRLADSEMDVRLGPDPSGAWQTHTV